MQMSFPLDYSWHKTKLSYRSQYIIVLHADSVNTYLFRQEWFDSTLILT